MRIFLRHHSMKENKFVFWPTSAARGIKTRRDSKRARVNNVYHGYTYTPILLGEVSESVDSLCRDGTDMRGDAQNPKSFQAPRM